MCRVKIRNFFFRIRFGFFPFSDRIECNRNKIFIIFIYHGSRSWHRQNILEPEPSWKWRARTKKQRNVKNMMMVRVSQSRLSSTPHTTLSLRYYLYFVPVHTIGIHLLLRLDRAALRIHFEIHSMWRWPKLNGTKPVFLALCCCVLLLRLACLRRLYRLFFIVIISSHFLLRSFYLSRCFIIECPLWYVNCYLMAEEFPLGVLYHFFLLLFLRFFFPLHLLQLFRLFGQFASIDGIYINILLKTIRMRWSKKRTKTTK